MITTQPLYFFALFGFVFVLSVVTAMYEIQIEGANGWAKKLPTWRMTSPFFRRLINRSEITGYHVYLLIFLMLMFHFPQLLSGWSWMREWTILSCYTLFNLLWDFLWFALNPAFGWRKYRKANIAWFIKWVGPFPQDYYMTIAMSGLFAYLRGNTPEALGYFPWQSFSIPVQHVMGWAMGVLACVIATVLIIALNGWNVREVPVK